MNDITEVMIDLLTDLINRGFQFPIYVFAVSEGGCVSAARYEWDAENQSTNVQVFADHEEGDGWNAPFQFFFVDGRGESESVRVDTESSTDTSQITH
jgi:hypothetical protein